MQTILLVDDYQEFQVAVTAALATINCRVLCASTAIEAHQILKSNAIDLILLDIGLPDSDGFQLFTEFRSQPQTQDIPIIFLTGKHEVGDKVTAFSMGADDYIQKPFNLQEFLARIGAKLKKISQKSQSQNVLRLANLVIYLDSFRACLVENQKESELVLTPLEFKLLVYLAKSPEQVFSREQILSAVWGQGTHIFDRTVDAHVSSIRKKIMNSPVNIKSVQNVGYKILVSQNTKKAA